MESKIKKNNRKLKTKKSYQVKDYGNDPFFIEKAKRSKEFLDKNGFPQELIDKLHKK